MNDEHYLQHCCDLLSAFSRQLADEVAELPENDPLRELVDALSGLAPGSPDFYENGGLLVSRLFTTYPELAPLLPRQLLWFFGGDCLHFMADEEMEQFQQLDEMRREAAGRGEVLDLREARAKLMNLQ
ncbi:MAG: PA2817 family protein [Halioglobus sp.]